MTVRYIQKALGGIEDLLIGQNTATQTRNGTTYTITKINSGTLPYYLESGDVGYLSIKDKIDAEAVLLVALTADVDGFPDELKNLTTEEIQQVENIGATTISAAQWGYLGNMDQDVSATGSPTFADATVTTLNTFTFDQSVETTASPTFADATVTTLNTFTFDQSVETTASPTFADGTFTGDITVAGSINGARELANVAAATTVAGTLATDFENGDTVDTVVLATSDRLLIKDQADATENGVYIVQASGAPVRATDADTSGELTNATVFVVGGSQSGTSWKQTTAAPVIGADNIVWISVANAVDLADINIDGGTDIGAALADVDLIIVDDGASGTNRKSALSRIATWFLSATRNFLSDVGIGVAAPARQLHIKDTGIGTEAIIQLHHNENDTGLAGIEMRCRTDAVPSKTAIVASGSASFGRSNLHFILNNDADAGGWDIGDSKMSLTTEGKLAISGGIDYSAASKGTFKGLEAIVWRLNTSVTNSDDPIGSTGGEWEIADDTENEQPLLATAVTESSGVFSFASTGYWLVTGSFYISNGSAGSGNTFLGIKSTDDNSTYSNLTSKTLIIASAGQSVCGDMSTVIKVSDITLDKVRSYMSVASATTSVVGSSTANNSYMMFVKLADL